MQNKIPLVSILMAAYNSEKYISEAIESVLAQTYQNWELIICDDCSKDLTLEIIKVYSNKDSRIKVIRNKENSGQATARNNAFRISKGDYIAIMDSDDRINNKKIESQLNYLLNNTSIGFVGCCSYMFNDTNGVYGEIHKKEYPSALDVIRNNGFVCATIMIRREIFENVGCYTVSKLTRTGEDYNLICKIYDANFLGANIQEHLYEYRVDNSNYKRRKYYCYYSEFRTAFSFLQKHWFYRFKIPKRYIIFVFSPLVKGLIPNRLIRIYHKFYFSAKAERSAK